MPTDPKIIAPGGADAYRNLGSIFASPWYLRVDDNLRVTSYNAAASVVLQIRHRFVDCEGNVQASQEFQTPNTDRSAKSTIIVTPEGWLLGGEIFASGASPAIGQTFVIVEIVRGLGSSALPLQVLAAGYLNAKQPLAFPNAMIGSSLDGGGALRSITGTTPGAGAEVSETVPTGARWELIAFRAGFTAAAGGANRQAVLIPDDGATRFFSSPAIAVIAPSAAGAFEWMVGSTAIAAINGQNPPGLIPPGMKFLGGQRIRTVTVNIAGGDQYAAPSYLVREWIEGA